MPSSLAVSGRPDCTSGEDCSAPACPSGLPVKGLPESSDNNSEIFSDWRVLDIFDEFRRISGFIAAYLKLVYGLICATYQSYAGEGVKSADIRSGADRLLESDRDQRRALRSAVIAGAHALKCILRFFS